MVINRQKADSSQEKQRVETVCRKLIELLEKNRGIHLVEKSLRSPSFKVKFSDPSKLKISSSKVKVVSFYTTAELAILY